MPGSHRGFGRAPRQAPSNSGIAASLLGFAGRRRAGSARARRARRPEGRGGAAHARGRHQRSHLTRRPARLRRSSAVAAGAPMSKPQQLRT